MESTNLEKLLRDAQELKEMGFEDEAMVILEEISLNYPNCLESYLEQIDILLNRKENTEEDIELALGKAQSAIRIAPNNLDAAYYIGYLYSLKRNWKEAKKYLEQAYQLASDDIDTLRVLGWVLFNSGERNAGILYLKQSIHLDPYFVEAMEDLAECYLYQEKFSEAQIVIEKAMEIAPESDRLLQLKLVAESFQNYKLS